MACTKCNGRGGFEGPWGWVRCSCIRPSAEAKRQTRRLHSVGIPRQLTLDDCIDVGAGDRTKRRERSR